jgi:hypothetical protein
LPVMIYWRSILDICVQHVVKISRQKRYYSILEQSQVVSTQVRMHLVELFLKSMCANSEEIRYQERAIEPMVRNVLKTFDGYRHEIFTSRGLKDGRTRRVYRKRLDTLLTN